jgi:hypothetical protein
MRWEAETALASLPGAVIDPQEKLANFWQLLRDLVLWVTVQANRPRESH